MKIRILSRKSDLAIIQAREFSDYLQSKHPFVEIEFLTRSTSGDKDLKHLFLKCQQKVFLLMI